MTPPPKRKWYNAVMHDEQPTTVVQNPLTAKQKQFVQEYLIDFNAAAAAERAGYSKKTARQIGQQNLSKLDIHAAILEQMQARAERTKITAEVVVYEAWQTFKAAQAEGKYAAAATLLSLLGRHTGAFPDRHEYSGPNGEPIPIRFIEFARAERPIELANGTSPH
jgi:hypothetical protein